MKDWKRKSILFLVSQNISLFGSSVVGYAITWYVTLKTSSGIWMTIAILCSIIPQLLVSLFAGVWADRYNRKYLIMLADGFIAAATLFLAAAFFSGYDSLWLLMGVSVIRSLGSGIQTPAVGALLPQLVPGEKLVRINGISQTLSSVLLMVSPAVGALLLGSVGVEWAMLVDVVTAVSAILVLSFLKVKKPEAKGIISMGKELKNGITYTLTHPFLTKILILYGIAFFLIAPAAFLSPLMIERSFGNEVWRLSANEILWMLGSFAGGAYVAWKGNMKNKWMVIGISYMGFGITFALLGVVPDFWMYLAIMFVSGSFMPPLSTAATVMFQENVEETMLGRVFSVVQIVSSGAMPLAMVIFGPLADLIKIEWIMIGSGILLALVGLWVVKSHLPCNFTEKRI